MTTSASCSIAPDSLKSESIGLWSVRDSTARDSCDSATTGMFSSLASAFKAREISEISCCLESARDVMLALEQVYRERYARNLTLRRLSEAVILPLCPDKGACLKYDANLAASVYLENDLEQLMRSTKL